MTLEFGPKSFDELQSTALKLIDIIYEAALNPAHWNEFLRAYGELYPGASQWLWLEDRHRADVQILMNEACDRSFVASYEQHFAATNPWTEKMLAHPEGHVHVADQLAPRDALVAGEFYNDWLKPQGLWDGFGASILKFGRHFMFYSLVHNKRAVTGERDLRLLQLLVPHMQRAAQLHGILSALEHRAAVVEAVLDQLSIGAMLCDSDGRVLFMNQAAEAIIILEQGDGISLDRAGRLRAGLPDEARALGQAIAGAAATGVGAGLDPGGAHSITRPSGKRPYLALVAPLGDRRHVLGLRPAPAAVVFLTDPDRKTEVPIDLLRRSYGLTAAEALLADALAQGRCIDEVAAAFGVTAGTARSQLKAIFAKTDTDSQAELLRLVASLGSTIPAAAASPRPLS